MITTSDHQLNVPRGLVIPEGSTHYDDALVNPFFKVEGEVRFQWFQNEWVPVSKDPRTGQYPRLPSEIKPFDIPSNAKRVNTIFGIATLVGKDCGRLLVDLDSNPFSFRPCAIWPDDIRKDLDIQPTVPAL